MFKIFSAIFSLAILSRFLYLYFRVVIGVSVLSTVFILSFGDVDKNCGNLSKDLRRFDYVFPVRPLTCFAAKPSKKFTNWLMSGV